MKKLAILGASGHGKVIADMAELLGYNCVFFDDAYLSKNDVGVWKVAGDTNLLIQKIREYDGVCIAIGHNNTREQKQILLTSKGANFPALIHPNSSVSRYAIIGAGSVVFAGVLVNAYSQIGNGVILNTGSIIEHDCILGDYSHISPGAKLAGAVRIGSRVWVGMGSMVKQLIQIGSGAIVGMGAVVTKDVPAGVTVVGNPARPLIKS